MSCNYCDTESTSGLCGACGSVKYCSRECQEKDWTVHKELCPKLPKSMRCVRWKLGLKDEEMKHLFEDCYPEVGESGLEIFIKNNFEKEVKVSSHLFFKLWQHALTETNGYRVLNLGSICVVSTQLCPKNTEFQLLTLKDNYLKKKLDSYDISYTEILKHVSNGYIYLSVLGPIIASLDKIINLISNQIEIRALHKGIVLIDSFIGELKMKNRWKIGAFY